MILLDNSRSIGVRSLLLGWILAILCCTAVADQPKARIGYQSMNGPFLYLAGSGTLEKITGYAIEWKKFESGSKMSLAFASNSIDIGIMGSTPFAVAISQNIPVELFWIAADIHRSEGLVAHPQSTIRSLSDLKGKRIATPFGSTAHFHLLVALEQAGIHSDQVQILNYAPSQIFSAWKQHTIDATFIWQPLLQQLEQAKGSVLVRSADISKTGPTTFDGLIVRSAWRAQHPKFLQALVQQYDKEVQLLREHPNSWNAQSKYIQINRQMSGASTNDVLQAIPLYSFPTSTEQKTSRWFASSTPAKSPIETTLQKTIAFLKKQKFIRNAPSNISQHIHPIFP